VLQQGHTFVQLDRDKLTRLQKSPHSIRTVSSINEQTPRAAYARPLPPPHPALLRPYLPSFHRPDPIPLHGPRRPRARPPRRALRPPQPCCGGCGGGEPGEVAGVRGGPRPARRCALGGGREDREAARGQGHRGRHRARHRLQEGTDLRELETDGSSGDAACRMIRGSSWSSTPRFPL
jgi:hypothetical protein